LEGREPEPFEFTAEEVERLAKMEHGRWNSERLLEDWHYGEKRDVANKISPYLVSWQELPDKVQEWDRDAVKEIPALLAQVGLQIQRAAT